MNKIFCTIIFLISAFFASAQTYYYQLTKKIVNDMTYTNMAGGQFITFKGNKCYDSDCNGNSVGNGELTYNESLSDKLLIYTGASYFGSTTSYRFTSDKSLLNVYTTNGRIYVYKRATQPSGVYTCTLIKEKRPQPNPFPNPPLPVYVPDPMPSLGGYIETTNISTSEPNPIPTEKTGGLTEAQYRHTYQGYEDVVKGILETFQICGSDMPYTARLQGIQTMRSAQKDMIRVRQEAASYGIIIPQSSYETVSP